MSEVESWPIDEVAAWRAYIVCEEQHKSSRIQDLCEWYVTVWDAILRAIFGKG